MDYGLSRSWKGASSLLPETVLGKKIKFGTVCVFYFNSITMKRLPRLIVVILDCFICFEIMLGDGAESESS